MDNRISPGDDLSTLTTEIEPKKVLRQPVSREDGLKMTARRSNRYDVRLVEAPIPDEPKKKLLGTALIVAEDDNRFGQALAEKLSQEGIRFSNISPDQPIETIGSFLEELGTEPFPSYLFLLGATEINGSLPVWQRTVTFSFVLLREWSRLGAASGKLGECTVLVPLRQGGDFGLASPVESVFSGTVSGLLKGFQSQWNSSSETGPRIKLVDQEPARAAEEAAEELFRELSAGDREQEIAYSHGKRYCLKSDRVRHDEKVSSYVPPLLESLHGEAEDAFHVRGRLHPQKDLFLREHLMNEVPILPLVASMEAYTETVVAALDHGLLPDRARLAGFDRFEVRHGMIFRSGTTPHRFRIEFRAETSGDNTVRHGSLRGDLYNRAGRLVKDDMLFSETDCKLILPDDGEPESVLPDLDFPVDPACWQEIRYPGADLVPLYHGKAFRCLGRIQLTSPTPDRTVVELSVPDPMQLWSNEPDHDGGTGFYRDGMFRDKPVRLDKGAILNGAVLDSTFYACGILFWLSYRTVCIPLAFDRFRFGRGKLEPGETGRAHLLMTDPGSEPEDKPGAARVACFDFTVRNSRGKSVYEVKNYKAIVLKPARNLPSKEA